MQNKRTAIDLWVGKCFKNAEQLHKMRSLLSSTELRQAGAFHFNKHSKCYIYAHAALRLILSQYSHTPPDQLNFLSNPAGKPYLLTHPDIRFNISHTKDMVAITVNLYRNIGVDIEKCVPLGSLNKIAKKIMSSFEYNCFEALNEEERLPLFYKCWVRKEAVVKAWGRGIDDNLNQLDVSGHHPSSDDEQGEKEWTIKDFTLPDGYVGAVCAEGGEFELIKKEIDELIMIHEM